MFCVHVRLSYLSYLLNCMSVPLSLCANLFCAVYFTLLGFTLPARRVDVVTSWVVGVHGTVVRVVVRAVKGVLVEAALLGYTIRVVQVCCAAQEELHVTLAASAERIKGRPWEGGGSFRVC